MQVSGNNDRTAYITLSNHIFLFRYMMKTAIEAVDNNRKLHYLNSKNIYNQLKIWNLERNAICGFTERVIG